VPQLHKLTGSDLLAALAIAKHPIKVFLKNDSIPSLKINPLNAINLVRSSVYEGTMKGKRLSHIREIDPRKPLPYQACYRTTGAASLPTSPEYLKSVGYRVFA
jgi:hypothetical protein